MKSIVKRVIEADGIKILNNPSAFRDRLVGEGYSEQDAITMELILTACPSIPMLLNQREITDSEAASMLSTAVKNTHLSPMVVRHMLGELFENPMNQGDWQSILLNSKKTIEGMAPSSSNEDAILSRAAEIIKKQLYANKGVSLSTAEKAELDVSISKLDDLSNAGNGYASYLIGLYHLKDSKEIEPSKYSYLDMLDLKARTGETAFERNSRLRGEYAARSKRYFTKAASQGFGPAFGALSDIELHEKYCSMSRAASFFEHPAALAGTEGKRWKNSAVKIINYREENKTRRLSTILMLALIAALGIIIAAVSAGSAVWPAILLVALPVLGIALCLASAKFFPYLSLRGIYMALAVAWLVSAFILVR